eukprot:TRINITY_DN8407_c0_g1_i1.p2 TRINITY_DN8407_c0_g1~~TRINITY_DN8407_c0_g1_i1.p2  ORF type:complete len:209 (+),score=63.81 TRINITY_DN8407_c0_g1_i1:85-627(+)
MTEQTEEKAPRLTAKEKKEAADAFSERMNATPAKCSEADRFREADDQFKKLKPEAFAAVRAACEDAKASDLPPEVAAVFESWCYLHGEMPASVAKCGELAADLDDFRLVGPSSIRSMSAEERAEVELRINELDTETIRGRPLAAAEAAAAMLEWLQAGLALQRWAEETQKTEAAKENTKS